MRRLTRLLLGCLALTGVGFILLLSLAFTPWPWRAYKALADAPSDFIGPPDYIVILGGGGIPSKSGLLRAYFGAEAARQSPDALVVIALPYEGALEHSSAGKVRDELVLRGIDPDRIMYESKGRNTREQAQETAGLIDDRPDEARLLIVTSPDHMKRAVLSFRKAGFKQLSGKLAFSEAIETDLRYRAEALGGQPLPLDVGQSMTIRYSFWNNLSYEIDVAREWAALAYYKLMGWI
ncbi:MAG TPA: hypothetical protein DCZ95_11535 [Verrucomicrobia bacterium]|nr:MAG: hypothetical protein A2X46_04065 [Lentisphaerae bacterium GWF2_57_35]HBA84716.1 hypothetical protein [Verrucomicrobiota bacterium]